MSKVFIGIGHGGTDPGAVANGLKESQINLNVGLKMKSELERHGVTVSISRTKEENDDLSEEIRECNNFKPDYAVDIHTNAGGGDGFEVFHTVSGGKGKEVAAKIEKEVIALGQNSRGLKIKKNSQGKDYFGFIRSTVCPAIILECAFIDNKADISIIDELHEQENFGIAYAKGVLAQLGIQYKPVQAPTPPPTTSNVYRIFKDGVQQGTAYSNEDNILNIVKDSIKNNAAKIEIIKK